ncbi:MAG TPA: UDP-N-acetylmuramoyl-L-alanine--D-glutamate ligase [Afifellaceae bacterium]|nr:UDP-N-acetylmuramoyl-L-alanine--D-glutamate ligase [Afifellaceae bacterium]
MSISLHHLAGRSIGVLGLARSGLATVRAAGDGGASVWTWDDKEAARDAAAGLGANVAEPQDWRWQELTALVLSPGVPLTHPAPHPVVGLAQAHGREIVCDAELLFREIEGAARIAAITGTNGKSTTTALLGHILGEAGLPAHVGGNIGRSALDLPPPAEGAVYVLEMSSYQLDLTARFRPDVAVWLNLTPDHLDRHGGFDGYRQAKERIFANMTAGDTAVLGVDQPAMQEVAGGLRGRADAPGLVTVSVGRHAGADLFVDTEGRLSEAGRTVADLAGFDRLRGAHNWQNMAAAYAAARALGLAPEAIMAGMASFPGLAHRMEVLGRRGRVVYVNDSKATNAEAAAPALASLGPIYWIAGGLAKECGIAPLAEHFPRIAKAYLIGRAADAFSATLAGRVPQVIAGDLETAVRLASADAAMDPAPEPAVLLSPACASFDQFADFEARGDAFRRAFEGLGEGEAHQQAQPEPVR